MIVKEYYNLTNIFSKRESDVLSLFRLGIDYKIELTDEYVLGYCSLYKISIKQLQFVKNYITKNLDKDFIVPSIAPFTSPILIAKKPNRGLYFYIDYWKLN